MATLAVAALLGLATLGIFVDALFRTVRPSPEAPGMLALWAAFVSILLKEGLFHYTYRVGVRTGSSMIIANAWHHRSDALSSVVAFVGIGAAIAGWRFADPLAAAVIALMLARITWDLGKPALAELVDTAPDPETAARIDAEIRRVPGVRDVHDLRLRRVGGHLRGNGHVTFDGHLTLSEAHRLTEAARAQACAAVPELVELLLHAEPEGHADGVAAHDAPLRPDIEHLLRRELGQLESGARIVSLRLDYRDDGLRLEIVLDRALREEAQLRARLLARLAPLLDRPAVITAIMVRS
jgi:cation diffusion facilitator family transporter